MTVSEVVLRDSYAAHTHYLLLMIDMTTLSGRAIPLICYTLGVSTVDSLYDARQWLIR